MATAAPQSFAPTKAVQPASTSSSSQPTSSGPASTGALNAVATPAVSLAPAVRAQPAAGGASGAGVEREQPKSWLERGAKWLGETVDKAIEFSDSLVWEMLEQFAPELVPIIRQGPLEWLKEKISTAVDSVFETVMAPVRAVSDVAQVLRGHFDNLMGWMTDAAARIARGDCKPIAEAAEKISQVFEGIAAPIVDRIKNMAERVRGFFSGLWDRFGAPVWDFLKRIGGQAWDKIQQLGRWIWDKTAPIRDKLSRAWTWIKNKLGIGEGPEGQDGILQWVQSKAATVWDQYIKPFVEKYKKPLMVAAGILALLSPAGPFLAVGGAIAGLVAGIKWIKEKLAKRGGAAEDRGLLEGTILPAITNAVDKVASFLGEKARSVTETLGKVMSGLGDAVAAVAGSVFRFAVNAFQWLVDRFHELVEWAREKLGGLVTWVRTGLQRLKAFAQPLLDFLKEVGRVAVDILTFPAFVAGKLWNLIPACIRDPFVDFLINQVLKRVPILKDVIEVVPKVWAKVKTTALTLIRMVFKEGDLKGALFEIFKLVLAALDIPLELVKSIIAKAGAAKDMILADPLGFLGNLLAAIKQGFIQFGAKILTHLVASIADWFRFVLKSAGLTPPTDFSLKAVFEFILQVLGITLEKILARIEQKIGKEAADKIRKVMSVLSKAWEWLSTLLNEGPMGVWNKLKGQLGNLWQALLDGAIGWVTGKVTKIALPRITAALGTAPIGAVVEAVVFLYNAIQTAAQYAKAVLEMVSSVLDAVTAIAKGAIAGAANLVENNLGAGLTVAIGFLANYLGLGDLGKKIKEIVEDIQKKVEEAIDWLIDKALAAGKAIIAGLKSVAGGILKWWKAEEPIPTTDGEKHRVYLDGNESGSKVMVASSPMDSSAAVEAIRKAPDVKPKQISDAEGFKKTIDDAVVALVAQNKALGTGATPGNKPVKDDVISEQNTILRAAMRGLATLLGETVFGKVKYADLEDTVIKPGSGSGKAGTIEAAPLSAKRKMGTPPTADSDGWQAIVTEGLTTADPHYVRLHLINENFGGRGDYTLNLVPGSKQNNGDHLRTVENELKDLIGAAPADTNKRAQVWYKAVVSYRSDAEVAGKKTKYQKVKASDFAQSINFTWGLYKHVKDKEWKKDGKVIGDFTLAPIPLPKLWS